MIVHKHKIFLISCLFLFFYKSSEAQSELINTAVKNVTNAIVQDVFSAPAASRIYAYSTIAAYEVMQMGFDEYHSFGVNQDSENYGKLIAEKIIVWSETDGFKQIRSLPRYTLLEKEGCWSPTPPDYAEAVEPYWGKLRTFVLDSATSIKPKPCLIYSSDSNSFFYKQAIDVYEIGNKLTEEEKLITRFWDDNPYTTKYIGHMQFAEKKVSPAGHWLDISRVAIELTHSEIIRAAQVYAAVSITNADAFISCWAEKYSGNLIRPETYINKYIDAQWTPFLQSPTFPEYPSGHSAISAASATILTYYFGPRFVFTDSSETIYDLPARTFGSFAWAANEASISRVYGGIHFRVSAEEGTQLGYDIGVFTLFKLFKKD